MAIGDTSALIAFFNAADKNHAATQEAIAQVGHLVVSPCVLAELDYLVATRQGPHHAKAILGYIASRTAVGRWEVPEIGPHLLAAQAVLEAYPSIGLTDALNTVLAREFHTDAIATLDRRHFHMIRPLTSHTAFRPIPDDL